MEKKGLDKQSSFRIEQISVPSRLEKIAPAGRIGIIALSTDFNIEQDLRRMLPPQMEIFTNRVSNRNPMTLNNLRAMQDDIARAAAGILPGTGVELMIYGCTSGTVAIGFDRIVELIAKTCPGIPVTTPITSAVTALKALHASKLSVLTPYVEEINRELGQYLAIEGFDIINVSGLGFQNDIDVTRLPTDEIVKAALIARAQHADALFISCTAFRASLVIEKIEQQLGIPVVSSNQALVWHAMRLLDNHSHVNGFGALFAARNSS